MVCCIQEQSFSGEGKSKKEAKLACSQKAIGKWYTGQHSSFFAKNQKLGRKKIFAKKRVRKNEKKLEKILGQKEDFLNNFGQK